MIRLRSSKPDDAAELLQVWRNAVDSSHEFLTPEDRVAIDPLVADYVASAELLIATRNDRPVAFMGVTGQNIDSLFIDPSAQRIGIGRLLTDTVRASHSIGDLASRWSVAQRRMAMAGRIRSCTCAAAKCPQ